MTVLILGVVYWFWTQNQYIQRKLNLLENIVYEMKSNISFHGGGIPDPVEKAIAEIASMPNSEPVLEAPSQSAPFHGLDESDVDDVLQSLAQKEAAEDHDLSGVPTSPSLEINESPIVAEELGDDLQPGGIGSGIENDVSDLNNESVLNAMGMKELKELARQKGINGAKNMRKHDLIAAIRASKMNLTPFEIREGTLELN